MIKPRACKWRTHNYIILHIGEKDIPTFKEPLALFQLYFKRQASRYNQNTWTQTQRNQNNWIQVEMNQNSLIQIQMTLDIFKGKWS